MRRSLCLASFLLLALSAPVAALGADHPLDPLTWQEHWTALEVLRDAGHLDRATRFSQLRLREPEKQLVLGWSPGDEVPRSVFAVVRQGERSFEAVVDLVERRVVSWSELEGEHPNWLLEELGAVVAEAMQHPDFLAAMKRRGIDDLTFIDCLAIPPGYFGTAKERGRARARRLAHVRCQDARGVRNTWARQIEGLTVVVDVEQGEVVEVVDEGAPPLHATTADFDQDALGPQREVPGPIRIEQPLGPGFRLDGHFVEWQGWRFHLRLDRRVGTVVSLVSYGDGEERRRVLYQGHLSEIFVPYMDPGFAWYARNFIDAGEFVGTGLFKPLMAGRDCPDYAHYVGSVQHQDNGRPHTVPQVLCIFERDAGDPSWRHGEDNMRESRPKRDLVVRSAAVIGNYDYLFDWVFQQDGSVRGAVGATGIVEVKMVAEASKHTQTASLEPASVAVADATPPRGADAYGHFVDPHIVAVNHDHYFSYRLDLDVDGSSNRFIVDRLVRKDLPKDHPRRSLWVQEPSFPQHEGDARVRIDYDRPALWRVASPSRTNHVGYPTSYQLLPGQTANPLFSADDYPLLRAGYIGHHLWVTEYRPDERYAAGEHPTLSEPGQGLPQWSQAESSIVDTDLVLWYTIGMHHLVRAEDWPVMPVMWHSFELRPFDFFDRNPAMDLPAKR